MPLYWQVMHAGVCSRGLSSHVCIDIPCEKMAGDVLFVCPTAFRRTHSLYLPAAEGGSCTCGKGFTGRPWVSMGV